MRVEYTRSEGEVYEAFVATDENPASAVRALREMLPNVFADKDSATEEEPVPIASSKRKEEAKFDKKTGEEIVIP